MHQIAHGGPEISRHDSVLARIASPCLTYTQPLFFVGILTVAGRYLANIFILILTSHRLSEVTIREETILTSQKPSEKKST